MLCLLICIINIVLFWLITMIVCKDISEIQITIKNIINNFFVIVIFIPFIEESIFRSCLSTLLKDYEYCDIITSLLFGLSHMINPFIITDFMTLSNKKKILLGVMQAIMTANVGYYFTTISLGNAIIFHMLLNLIAQIIFGMRFYTFRNNIKSNNVLYSDSLSKCDSLSRCLIKSAMVKRYRIKSNLGTYYCDTDTRVSDMNNDYINIINKPTYIKNMFMNRKLIN